MMQTLSTPKFILSALCLALLTACGGGGEGESMAFGGTAGGGTGGTAGGGAGGAGGAGGEGAEKTNPNKEPPINKFLVEAMKDKGQQNSPIVTSLDYNNNNRVDAVDSIKFNQPGIISEVCKASECTDMKSEEDEKINKNKVLLKEIDEALEKANKAVSDAKDEEKKKQAQAVVDNYQEQKTKLEEENKQLEEEKKKKGEYVVVRGINNRMLDLVAFGTVDNVTAASENVNVQAQHLVHKDAGIAKIDKKREDGQLKDYGGTIGREFNGVWLFRDKLDNNKFANAYMRNPAAAGWSYQTFGVFTSDALLEKRDVMVGYQSVGQGTETLPKRGRASYTGIAHAYYNDNQVTMRNRIVASFAGRSLSYSTTQAAVLHTFENGQHIIEDRADLNLTGSARWNAGVNRFKGDMTAANGLQGKIEGQFYGSNAEEVGGVFGLKGDVNGTNVHYVGGFGAKQ